MTSFEYNPIMSANISETISIETEAYVRLQLFVNYVVYFPTHFCYINFTIAFMSHLNFLSYFHDFYYFNDFFY